MKCVIGWRSCAALWEKNKELHHPCQRGAATTLPRFSLGCRKPLFPGSMQPAEAKLHMERMLPAPAVWLMLHHLLWRVRQGEQQAFEEPINPACKVSS